MAKIFESCTDESQDILDDCDDWGPENDFFAPTRLSDNGIPRNGSFRNPKIRRQHDLFEDFCDSSI